MSLGEDGKLCVWERFQGHLINSVDTVWLLVFQIIPVTFSACRQVLGNQIVQTWLC